MTSHPVEGQWLDFYALLDVPVNADEDTIRKRIGKVYSEAAANADHRDLERRHYFQALVERVLPQCRRVLLDPQWRAKYDRQHILHSISDPTSQDYVTFIGSMRSKEDADSDLETLPQRIQDDITTAREVVECARQGAELELLPSRAVSSKEGLPTLVANRDANGATANGATANGATANGANENGATKSGRETQREREAQQEQERDAKRERGTNFQRVSKGAPGVRSGEAPPATFGATPPPAPASAAPSRQEPPSLQAAVHLSDGLSPSPGASATSAQPVAAPGSTSAVQVPMIDALVSSLRGSTGASFEEIKAEGEPVRAQVITAQEAAEIRRRRKSNPDADAFIAPRPAADGSVVMPLRKGWKAPKSRVIIDDPNAVGAQKRLISPTSMNLMVAITGVLLTITIQKFASTPAVATNVGRMPIFVAVASEMEGALLRAESGWEKTPEGANFDLIVQPVDSGDGLRRALGAGGQMPDVWIPSDSTWADLYNAQAPRRKRETLVAGQSVAQTPMVLIARADRSSLLRSRFSNHQIPSWEALRGVVGAGAPGHFGLTNPQKAATGALARLSMAREWGASHGQSSAQAAKNPGFWGWMASFEDNAPAAPAQTAAMMKDLVLGTTGRYWWALAYESDALQWMSQDKPLEIFYLPRTTLADHPFCAVERVGAPLEVAQARASFEKFLRGSAMQKELLDSGFRPTEVGLQTKTRANPFLSADFRAHGARTENLPRDERPNAAALETVAREWGKRFG